MQHTGGQDLSGASDIRQWIVALYFAMTTVTTVGYGDITAHSAVEQVSILLGLHQMQCMLKHQAADMVSSVVMAVPRICLASSSSDQGSVAVSRSPCCNSKQKASWLANYKFQYRFLKFCGTFRRQCLGSKTCGAFTTTCRVVLEAMLAKLHTLCHSACVSRDNCQVTLLGCRVLLSVSCL